MAEEEDDAVEGYPSAYPLPDPLFCLMALFPFSAILFFVKAHPFVSEINEVMTFCLAVLFACLRVLFSFPSFICCRMIGP